MFFVASKLFWFVAEPGNFLVLLLASGIALHAGNRHRRLGLGIAGAAAAAFLLILALPVGSWLVKPLEDRFPHSAWPDHVDGILVLGGGASPGILAQRGMPLSLTSAARVLAAADAARHYPGAKLVFSGGSGQLIKGTGTEADVARVIFRQAGIDPSSVIFESRSANTWENIVLSRQLVSPKSRESWLLVTSAFHMPRAMGVAQKLGWKMMPWPSDYLTGKDYAGPEFPSSFSANLNQFELAVHEWMGLAAYRLTSKTVTLIPARQRKV